MTSTRRLFTLFAAPLLASGGILLAATPAQAAVVEEFSVNGVESGLVQVEEGDPITVTWDVSGDDSLTVTADLDGWDEPGATLPASGTQDPVPPAVGETATFRILAQDGASSVSSAIVGVQVVAAGDTVVTPAPVTTPAPCVIEIPASEGVSYSVGFAEDDIEGDDLEPGRYPVSDFTFLPDVDLVAFTTPRDGFAFPEDAQTEFPVEVTEDCFPRFVDAEAVCQGVAFTNVSGEPITLFYTGLDGDGDDTEDGETELAPGAQVTVDTRGDVLVFAAGRLLSEDEAIQIGVVEVDQDCVRPDAARTASHPTVAPAAGTTGSTTHGVAVTVAASALLAGAALGLRRRLN